MQEVEFHVHRSLAECMRECWGDEYSLDFVWEGFKEDGIPYKFTLRNAQRRIRKIGCWGFCKSKGEIHLWVDPRVVKTERLARTIGHEVGHTVHPYYTSSMKEETKAGSYGDAAEMAYTLAKRIMKDLGKRGHV